MAAGYQRPHSFVRGTNQTFDLSLQFLVISVFKKPASMESSLYKACAGRMGWAGLIQVSFSLITTMSGILESHPIKLPCFSAPVELRGCSISWMVRCWEQKVLRAIILTAKIERLCPVLWYFHDDISVTRWGMVGCKYATTLSSIMRALENQFFSWGGGCKVPVGGGISSPWVQQLLLLRHLKVIWSGHWADDNLLIFAYASLEDSRRT